MLIREQLKVIAKNQKIKLLDRGDTVFTGYSNGEIKREWLNRGIYMIFCGSDDFLVIDML